MGLGLLLLLGGVASGCRHDGSQQDAYIRDLRMHEQQIYELQDYMTEYQELLRQQRKENAKLREQLASRQSEGAGSRTTEEEAGRSLLDGPPGLRGQRPAPLELDDKLPSVDPGIPSVDPGIPSVAPGLPAEEQGVPLPRTLREEPNEIEELPAGTSRSGNQGRNHLASFVGPVEALPPATAVALYAEQISLEPNSDAAAQEVGLMAIVEPLTETGGAGDFRGELSLMIVDPIAPKDGDWEVARWDYTVEEVEQSWRSTSRRVLDLPLAAPPETPVGRPLELWIQLLPHDGSERILARTTIELGPPTRAGGAVSGGPAAHETHVSSRWQAATSPQMPKQSETSDEGSWKPSSRLLPPATPQREQPLAVEHEPGAAAPGWSPRR